MTKPISGLTGKVVEPPSFDDNKIAESKIQTRAFGAGHRKNSAGHRKNSVAYGITGTATYVVEFDILTFGSTTYITNCSVACPFTTLLPAFKKCRHRRRRTG